MMLTHKNSSIIALGSNLSDPCAQLQQAIDYLNESSSVIVTDASSIYANPPIGEPNQPVFYNAVVSLKTSFSAPKLLQYCQAIEKQQKRVKTIHWGPRTIDLDIISFNKINQDNIDLTLPHPEAHKRRFVLEPMMEILGPDFELNGKKLNNHIISLDKHAPKLSKVNTALHIGDKFC